MSTRSGSSRRKLEQPRKKVEDQIDLTDGDEEQGENGVESEDDVIELPEGTVVVQPEPVDDDDTEGTSTPKSGKKRQQKSSLSMSVELNKLMSRILCTACGKQLNPNNTGAVRRHPWLKVITCKRCYKFLKSGPIQKDEDGLDEQCRWCGEGGRLYGCDYCHNTFCRPCIKRNLGRSEAAKLEEGGGKWKCYVCKPLLLKELVENCNKVMAAIEKEEQKEKAREERAKEREKEAKKKEKEGKDKDVSKDNKDEKQKDARDSKSSTPTRTTLRAPVPKSSLQKCLEEPLKTSAKPIVINDDKPAKNNKSEPIVITDSSSDKSGTSGTAQVNKNPVPVLIGPRPRQPVTMPYINKTIPLANFNNQGNRMMSNNPPNTGGSPLLLGAIQNNLGSAYARGISPRPITNDIQGLLQSVYPYNVDSSVDKLIAAAQYFSLSLNEIKTDLAIAKLTNVNMFNARNTAATTLKSRLAVFFNSVREIFNVQITATAGLKGGPSANVNASKIVVDGKPAGTNLEAMAKEYLATSTPIKEESSKQKLDISEIPILVEDSPMKKSSSDPVIVDKAENSDKEQTSDSKDDSCIVLSQSEDDKNVKHKENNEKSDKMEVDESKRIHAEDAGKKIENDKEKGKESNGTESDGAMEVGNEENRDKKEKNNEKEDEVSEETLKKVSDSSKELMQKYKTLADKIDNPKENSENLAAQLEILREMADELTHDLDDEDKSKESEEDEDGKDNKRKTRGKDSQKHLDSKSSKSSEKDKGQSSQSGSKRSLRRSKDSSSSEATSVSKMENEKADDDKETSVKQEKDKNSEEDIKDDSADKTMTKSESEKSPVKTESRSTRLRSKKEENTDSEADSSKDSQKFKPKSKSESDRSARDDKKSDKKKAETDDTIEKDKDKSKKDSKAAKSTKKALSTESSPTKSKPKVGKVTEIVTDEETDESDIDGAPKGDKGDLAMASDDSEDIEFDDSNPKTRSKKTMVKGKGKDSKFKSPVRSKGKDDSEDGSKSKKSSKKTDDDEEDYKSDSSNFDPELEKEIKGISKSLANDGKGLKKKKKGKEGSEAEEKKDKKGKEKKKAQKKDTEKSSDAEESSNDDEEEVIEEEEEDEEEDEDNLSPSQLRKLRAAREAAKTEENDEEEDNDMNSDVSSDSEVSFPKLQTPKKGSKKKGTEEMSEDSDFEPAKKKRIRNKLLDAKISGDDSDEEKSKKGKKGAKGSKRKRKASSSEEEDGDEDEEDSDTEDYSSEEEGGKKKKKGKKGKGKKGKKGKGKKRRRIKRMPSSEEEEVKEPGAEDDIGTDDDDDEEGQGGFMKRKKIRKVMKNKKLKSETKQAQKAEEARRKRIEERQKEESQNSEYNSYIEVEGEEDEEDLPEGVEREKTGEEEKKKEGKEGTGDTISKILGSPRKVPVTTKLVLEMDKEKKKPLIEVDRTLIRKLKPHQVDAVRFIYNCTVESMERIKKEEGSGCIVAHCMGLGKTLSVITFVHTMLKSHKYTNMFRCLVVCPLNTVLNWVNEFEIWLDDVDFEIEVYELSRVKMNSERAQMLKEWHSGGAGVMILGYDMYRNLVQGSHCKNKKQKQIFFETLADPGPDLVVCDEGHILKNDVTSISKAMNKIKSRRRIVLTGTPLQNNLGEYHCMVNFVKPNLLGTRKEFGNRFVNPITNGQCTDSTPTDVKLMKRRAHVLHEMLAGCVQRKDYSALTKFLPPKFEYVISVRLAPIQMDLYEKYLERGSADPITSKGARLFKDYQALMRIWTHPWVLKLDEVRQQNKALNDDSEDSFIDDEGSDSDSFITDKSTSSEGDVSPMEIDSGSEKGKRKARRTRGSRKKSNSDSDATEDESKKQADENEVVKKWTSRRRGNEEGAGSSWMDIGVPEDEFINKEISNEWWAEYVKEEDQFKMELSGKLTLLFEILKMCEDIGDKVLVFSQSLLSLDIIEDFLAHIDEMNQTPEGKKDEDKKEEEKKEGEKKGEEKPKENGEVAGGSSAGGSGADPEGSGDGPEKKDKFAEYGKNWTRGADYFRMDGSTNAQNRKAAQNMFNDEDNYRARLFLISTKAGSLGINLVAANRVIIFDASWNPSHDIQSIFRVYRFGQTKPVYVYRFLAQGTMEEKIYERQVTKQSLSQRVIDEHQIERHFTTADLAELYRFTPDRLDDPNRKEKLPMLPKDHMLAELMTSQKQWIVTFHEHDSLLENIVEQELTEEEKKAAWEDYEEDKKGLRVNPMMNMYQQGNFMGGGIPMGGFGMQQGMNPAIFKNLLDMGQSTLGPNGVLRIVQDLKSRFPNLPPEMFQHRVVAVLQQILAQQRQQSDIQRRQLDQQKMAELNRLYQVKQQIQQQINQQSRARMASMGGATPVSIAPAFGGAQQSQMRMSGSDSNLLTMRNQNQNQPNKR